MSEERDRATRRVAELEAREATLPGEIPVEMPADLFADLNGPALRRFIEDAIGKERERVLALVEEWWGEYPEREPCDVLVQRIRHRATEADYQRAMAEIESLMAADPPAGSPDGERLSHLGKALEKYERVHYPIHSAGISTGELDHHGELELVLDVNGERGSVFLSREIWEGIGEKAGWWKP